MYCTLSVSSWKDLLTYDSPTYKVCTKSAYASTYFIGE